MDNYIVVGDPELAPDVPPTSVGASEVSYTNTTSGLSATNVQGAIDEVVDISGNTSSALVEQSIGTFPEFAISTNSADSYYSDGRGGVRNSSEKLLIFSVSHLRSDGTKVSVGFQLYATSQEALEQSSYTQYGDLVMSSYKTQSGHTIYVGTQTGRWATAIPSTDELLKANYCTTVTIDGKTKRIQNVVDMKYRSGRNFWLGYNPMVDQIVDKVLFGEIDYPSGIYSTKSNNEIISLFENSVAHNEPTTTASQAYSVGQYMVRGGNLKKVTSAISSGESITGNNTRNTTVGEELSNKQDKPTTGVITLSATDCVPTAVGTAVQYHNKLLVGAKKVSVMCEDLSTHLSAYLDTFNGLIDDVTDTIDTTAVQAEGTPYANNYWTAKIDIAFKASSGNIYLNVKFKGDSQIFSNLRATKIYYEK